jgi:hypothetical protein
MGTNQGKFFFIGGCFIWLVAIASLIGIHFVFRHTSKEPSFYAEIRTFVEGVGLDLKQGLSRYENAVLRAEAGKVIMLGLGFENDEERLIAEKVLRRRKIDFWINDPLALERKSQVSEAFKTLNNAEKSCFANGFGAIIYRDGEYLFIVNVKAYEEYARTVGTDCKACDRIKAGKGGGH